MILRRSAVAALTVLLAAPGLAGSATAAASAPAGPAPVNLELIAEVPDVVDLAWRTGDTTLFTVRQTGQVVPVRDGIVGEPVLDLGPDISTGGERGLLGLAFDASGTKAYVDFTDPDGNTVVAEYAVDPSGAFSNQRVLLTQEQPYPNHNGGDVLVGPDRMLYVTFGDGGAAGDPERRAMKLDTLLGKIIRIDPTPSPDGTPYTIPADNPFVGTAGARGEIWSLGLRNPWRVSFDRPTGDLWIADVGQGSWEEVDVARAADGAGRGLNFGWSAFEGTHPFNTDVPTAGVTMPVYEYQHGERGCSISGGVVAHDTHLAGLDGWYVYSDYCSGSIRALHVTGTTVDDEAVLASAQAVSAVVDGPDGTVYALSMPDGVYALRPA